MNETYFNLTNMAPVVLNNNSCIQDKFGQIIIDSKCIVTSFCNQMSSIMIRNGIIILICFLFHIFIVKWYFDSGYKLWRPKWFKESFKFRYALFTKIQHVLFMAMAVYILVVVYVYL